MMQVRWTTLAAEDLQHIALHIQRDNPSAAREVAQTLYENAMSLETLPGRGRTGRIAGTLELVSFPPFIIVYRITTDAVEILRIYHGAQDWP